jgi:ribosome-associated protein
MSTTVLDLSKDEILLSYIHSSGPGGQNVNKVSTAVQLRLDVRNSPTLPVEIKERLVRLAGSRMTEDGILVIEAHRFRTREANRQDALRRLGDLLERASHVPRPRKPTRPTSSSQRKRLEVKRRHGELKQNRKWKSSGNDE